MKACGRGLVALVVFGALPLLAQNTYVGWWSLGSGASGSSAGNTAVRSSVGQGIVASSSAGDVGISSGFLSNPMTHGPVSEVEEYDPAPRAYCLLQNYPNPFNPSTTIKYELSERSHVTLAVFNMLGQKVRTLVDETMDAGYQSAEFNAAGLASGVYFYRLTAGDFVQTRKMLLLQ